jgi:hypothetical protein
MHFGRLTVHFVKKGGKTLHKPLRALRVNLHESSEVGSHLGLYPYHVKIP